MKKETLGEFTLLYQFAEKIIVETGDNIEDALDEDNKTRKWLTLEFGRAMVYQIIVNDICKKHDIEIESFNKETSKILYIKNTMAEIKRKLK